MDSSDRALVVGAGPVGLAAALFVARDSMVPRVIDAREEPEHQSRALAVNPRTLELLESTGVTEQMLERGLRVYGAQFHSRGKIVGGISFDGIQPRYPYMLALSQATTVSLLSEALEKEGGIIDRGTKLIACRNVDDGVEAILEQSAGNTSDTDHYQWLLAADGAHSLVRQQLGIDFNGSSFKNEWHLVDVPLRTSLAEDRAHVFLEKDGGFLFLIRAVDDVREEHSKRDKVWRVFGNQPEPLTRMTEAEQAGPIVWSSSFKISHKIANSFSVGTIFLAGDAAHIHSPAGARGMNLGIEDAWVLAQLAKTNRLQDYDKLRRPVDQRVVHQVELLSKMIATDSFWYRMARNVLFPIVTGVPFIRSRMVMTLTGLDHSLPDLSTQPSVNEQHLMVG